MYIIGIDIGGTNTDAVLIDETQRIIAACKAMTTEDISIGFSNVLEKLLTQTNIDLDLIQGVYVGTTHATNAILQNKDLYRVGIIRIAGQRPQDLPAAYAWPEKLRQSVVVGFETIAGGYNCNGMPITPFSALEGRAAVERLQKKGAESFAIVGVFSPLCAEQEQQVAELIGPAFPVTLSSDIGGIGFIERENSTILNAALKSVLQRGFRSLAACCLQLGLRCPLMITQNDGSLIELDRAIEFPVLTISAGPTNSFVGGTRLLGGQDAIVVDIGGTSTDVGLVRNGFPLRSLNTSIIGGVALNFPMPDVLSEALGGGTIVGWDSGNPVIGPTSVGSRLTSCSIGFGGESLTLTDVALKRGSMNIDGAVPERIDLSSKQVDAISVVVKSKICQMIAKVRGVDESLPVVFVGGGARLMEGWAVPPHYDVANAYGAALSEVSGVIDTVVSLTDREKVLSKICDNAKEKALANGACEGSLRLVDQQIIPYAYIPNQMARVVVRYSGRRKV